MTEIDIAIFLATILILTYPTLIFIALLLHRLSSSATSTGMKLKSLLHKGWGTPDIVGGGYSLYFSKDRSESALVHDTDGDVLVIHNVETDEVLWEAKYE